VLSQPVVPHLPGLKILAELAPSRRFGGCREIIGPFPPSLWMSCILFAHDNSAVRVCQGGGELFVVRVMGDGEDYGYYDVLQMAAICCRRHRRRRTFFLLPPPICCGCGNCGNCEAIFFVAKLRTSLLACSGESGGGENGRAFFVARMTKITPPLAPPDSQGGESRSL
jgi:hypothetical protein